MIIITIFSCALEGVEVFFNVPRFLCNFSKIGFSNVEWYKILITTYREFSLFLWFFLLSSSFLGLLLFGDTLNIFK